MTDLMKSIEREFKTDTHGIIKPYREADNTYGIKVAGQIWSCGINAEEMEGELRSLIQGFAMAEPMTISVYADTTGCFSEEECDRDNNALLELPKGMVQKFFMDCCLESFRGDDRTVSDQGLFEEWLDEYTNDDTVDLVRFLRKHDVDIKGVLI